MDLRDDPQVRVGRDVRLVGRLSRLRRFLGLFVVVIVVKSLRPRAGGARVGAGVHDHGGGHGVEVQQVPDRMVEDPDVGKVRTGKGKPRIQAHRQRAPKLRVVSQELAVLAIGRGNLDPVAAVLVDEDGDPTPGVGVEADDIEWDLFHCCFSLCCVCVCYLRDAP